MRGAFIAFVATGLCSLVHDMTTWNDAFMIVQNSDDDSADCLLASPYPSLVQIQAGS